MLIASESRHFTHFQAILVIACVAADFFPVPGGAEIEQASEKCASEGARLGWAKKLGRSGEGVGRKGIACDQSQTLNRTPIAHERGAIVQFDWLLVRQSKYDIRNLSFMHNPTSGTQQDQNRDGQVWRSIRSSLHFITLMTQFSVQETSKDLLQNTKLILLKLEQKAVIRI